MEDPRDNRGKKHDLCEILALTVIGYLLGKTDFVNMAHCLRKEEKELRRFLPLRNGIPSHDTFSRAMRIVEPKGLAFLVCDWFCCLAPAQGRHLAIDGKGILAAAEKNHHENTPYLLNVLETASSMVLMQLKVGEKTNELGTIPELLKYLDLEGNTVTIDAIGTQKEIAREIVGRGGHFVLPVKENQPLLLEEIRSFMEDEEEKRVMEEFFEEDKGHGRIEKRVSRVTHDTSCIMSQGFGCVKTIGKVERERGRITYTGDRIETEKEKQTVYYISDLELGAEELARYVRGHWKVENELHWVLDNCMKEDRSRARKGNAIQNLGLMRKVAYNILRLHGQKMPGHSMEYLIDELRYDIPMIIQYISSNL